MDRRVRFLLIFFTIFVISIVLNSASKKLFRILSTGNTSIQQYLALSNVIAAERKGVLDLDAKPQNSIIIEEKKNESSNEKIEKIEINKINSEKTENNALIKDANQESDTYLIGPEDVLSILVRGDESLSRQVIVRPDGMISLPLIGDVKASGKTTKALSQNIADLIANFRPNSIVTVIVENVNNLKIYIIGKVNQSGEFIVKRYINVIQALSMAGGLAPFAKSEKIHIIRTSDKKQINIPFNYNEVMEGKKLEQNIMLQSGDVIVVP